MTNTWERPMRFRNFRQRLTTTLWGVLVIGFGAFVIANLSGYTFDLELAAIIALGTLGAWIFVSAALTLRPKHPPR